MQTAPARWNMSWACAADKSNHKQGVRGLRLVHRLCPFAKAMYKFVRSRGPQRRSPQMHFGLVRGRRREAAIFQQNFVSWYLNKAGRSHCIRLYDLLNAFGVHAAADRATLRHDDAYLGGATSYRSLMRLGARDDSVLYRLGDGAIQGHQPIPAKDVWAMAPDVDEWRERCAHDGQRGTKGFWASNGVPMAVRIVVFRSKVQGGSLSGSESFALPKGFLMRIDHRLGRYSRGCFFLAEAARRPSWRLPPTTTSAHATSHGSQASASGMRRDKRQRIDPDESELDQVGFDLLRLALGTSARQRVLRAPVETTVLIPREHPLVALFEEAGRSWMQASDAGDAARYGPPHLSQVAALLDWLCQQQPVAEELSYVDRYRGQNEPTGLPLRGPSGPQQLDVADGLLFGPPHRRAAGGAAHEGRRPHSPPNARPREPLPAPRPPPMTMCVRLCSRAVEAA